MSNFNIKKLPNQKYNTINTSDPIDAVYTWVDMNDPKWISNYTKYATQPPKKIRYQNVNEIKYSIYGLKKFCPFIRYIYIVTDNQNPPINLNDKKIKIIDHKQILGKECAYPTFKSNSIESYLHKIPGLSEIFLYFNDDCFVGKNINKRMFISFKNKLPIAHLKKAKLHSEKIKKAPHLHGNLNAIKLINKKFNINIPMVKYTHQATLMRKTSCELTWRIFYNELCKSVQYPTRYPFQHTIVFQTLSQFVGTLHGQMLIKNISFSPIQILYGDFNTHQNYLRIKNLLYQKHPNLFCINNLHSTSDKRRFIELMEKYYNL